MIEFLIANWLLFLIVAAAGIVLAVGTQLLNMKMLMDGDGIEDGGIFKRFGLAAIFGLIGSVSGIALILSIILNAIEHFSA
tara:strand:- start:20098 stop:20340 length:243 start_codon:yes stop_codon:yes gene_type:complete